MENEYRGNDQMVLDAYNLLCKYDGDLNRATPSELVKVLMQHSPDPEAEIQYAIKKYNEVKKGE